MRERKFRFIFKNGNFFTKRYMTLDELLDSNFALEQMEESINCDSNIFDIEDYPDYKVFKDEYTGLKDKNDVEIYEGDILRQTSSENKDIIHIVIYSEDDASFLANNIKLGKDYTCSLNKQWCIKKEVIGNIYENQELLES